MIWVIREYKEGDENYVVVKLNTSCCKDEITFLKLTEETYFDCAKCEPCSFQWNMLIKQAYANKAMYLKLNTPS